MKSIMHEASSLAKAIEQGWEKAGKPIDFSIKILETPQKNFFGFTTHSAKIAIYFDERPQQRHDAHAARPQHKQREAQPRTPHRPEHRAEQRPVERQQRAPAQKQPEVRALEQRSAERARPQRQEQRPEGRIPESRIAEPRSIEPRVVESQAPVQRHEAQWSEDMTAYVREWLGVVLPESVGKQVGFTVEPNNLYLRITFESPMLDNPEKEKRLYASLSLLILEALKRKFRVGLRRHKIILTNG